MKLTGADIGDSISCLCKAKEIEKITSLARDKIATDLDLIDENIFAFCWVVDYPMFEKDDLTKKLSSVIILSIPKENMIKLILKNP